MHQQSDVKVAKIEKFVTRTGFDDRFHRVTFEMVGDGLLHCSFEVWVPSAHPETSVEHEARTLLWRRLLDLAQITRAGALLEREPGIRQNRSIRARRVARNKHRRNPRLESAESDAEIGHVRIARYILSGHDPVPCDDLVIWKTWMETPGRLVRDTSLTDASDNLVRICTVFLGVDVGFGLGQPILFETMVLGGKYDRELYRYCTWEDSQEGHAAIVEQVQAHDKGLAKNSVVLKARDLAQRTVEKSGKVAVKTLIEQTAC
jgi:hypothetical protein